MSRNARRITLRDVAAAAGVSVGQASFALNGTGRVARATAERVRRAAAELGYEADATARALRTGRTGVYGVVLRNMGNPFFLDVLGGMEECADETGATLLIVSTDYDRVREDRALRRLAAQHVDGIAIAPIGPVERLEAWAAEHPALPLVAFNCSRPASSSLAVHGPDEDRAIALAMDHLARAGHGRVTMIAAPEGLVADLGREEAFRAQCDERRMQGEIVRSPLEFEAVAARAELVIRAEPRPAFLVNSDYLAGAVYRAARRAGKRVGEEVSVIGHDDLPTSALLDPPLTTIAFDRRALGRRVMGALLGISDATAGDRLPVELIERGSVGQG